MPKMTTEQFLSHLGIEVGKPFRENEFGDVCDYIVLPEISFTPNFPKPLIINFDDHLVVYHYPVDTSEPLHYFELSHLLNLELKPLPEYTLTEDDKSFVSLIPEEYKWVIRQYNGNLWLSEKKPRKQANNAYWISMISNCPPMLIFDKLFQFIQFSDDDPTSLDELRKCL